MRLRQSSRIAMLRGCAELISLPRGPMRERPNHASPAAGARDPGSVAGNRAAPPPGQRDRPRRGCPVRFAEIATPIFEFTEVFARPIGEHTDIVSKEMYTFTDRGGEEVTLRPENTAGVVRAVLSNGLTQSTPLKFFYSGPMFRYERPQKGRFRQFHQIGVELLGVAAAAGRYRGHRARPSHPEGTRHR